MRSGTADVGADLVAWAAGVVQSGKGLTSTVLGLLGTAFGMLVHQVAMHCFERGGLMVTVWNMFTALMGAKQGSSDEVSLVSGAMLGMLSVYANLSPISKNPLSAAQC